MQYVTYFRTYIYMASLEYIQINIFYVYIVLGNYSEKIMGLREKE